MANTQIKLIDPVHILTARVFYGDTDAGGVVYYGNYLRFLEMGRTEFMRQYVCPYRELEEQGIIMPVVECFVRYKAPALYDDLLVVKTSLVSWNEITCRFNYHILREIDTKLLLIGYTAHAAVSGTGKLGRLPASMIERMAKVCPGENMD